jgi:hypothetical protein
MTDTDPFAAYGEQQDRRPARAKRVDGVRVLTSEKQAPMKPSAMEQAQRDKSAQLAHYKREKKKEHQALLDAVDVGPDYARMVGLCRKLPDTAAELVKHLNGHWVKLLDRQQQVTVLGIIDNFIIRAREMDGRAPMDDPLPGQRDNLFLICRRLIMGH